MTKTNLIRKLGLVLAAIALAAGIFAVARRRIAKHGLSQISITSHSDPLPSPQVTLVDLRGTALNTSSLNGKVIVVNFWAAWCTPCAEEVPRFIALQQKYQNQGLQVIGISIDDSESELRDFYQRSHMNYPVIPGSQEIIQAYGGIFGLPTTVIIGRDGRMHSKLTGSTDFSALEQAVGTALQTK